MIYKEFSSNHTPWPWEKFQDKNQIIPAITHHNNDQNSKAKT